MKNYVVHGWKRWITGVSLLGMVFTSWSAATEDAVNPAQPLRATTQVGVAADSASIQVSASSHETSQWGDFKPENTLDGDKGGKSSWRADGDGEWIQYDLGEVKTVAGLRIAFVQGDQRTYSFDVQVSQDGKKWLTRCETVSSGKTTDFELVDIPDTAARYVRVVGHGGSKKTFENWINLTEVEIQLAK